MKKSRMSITAEQKRQIISESYVSGCIISQVAQCYGISKKTLYGWRSRERRIRGEEAAVNNSGNKFVELSIQKTTVQETKCAILKKAELTFSDFSLSIEGNVNSSKLLEIVKILDRAC
ncbi:transposase [Candidatus Tisiphia endosymbiont of Oplodontha viridula]|uniref:transposase n=1 Tax=Candidatus Tisiphia endosymbiont of Oplodontha viridula TaxID=3077925 RepID=UPI0035C8CAA9